MVSADVKKARRNKLVEVLKKKMHDKYSVDEDGNHLNAQLREIVDDVMTTVSGTNVTRDDLGEFLPTFAAHVERISRASTSLA